MNSIQLTYGRKKDGTPNAIFDILNRVVCSFPDVGGEDTRKGSPSTAETMKANAALFCAAPELLAALEGVIEHVIINDAGDAYHAARAAIAKAEGGQP